MSKPPRQYVAGRVDISELLPNPNQAGISAATSLLAYPPVVLTATQHGKPPKMKAGAEMLGRG